MQRHLGESVLLHKHTSYVYNVNCRSPLGALRAIDEKIHKMPLHYLIDASWVYPEIWHSERRFVRRRLDLSGLILITLFLN